ncbi:hypothetical protein DPMN_004520 [Dreissena polymorpha]|uniref:Uncharacterized protein n=1 Tax=Dreissena polymorpha TaxID=45954 RepID=A0A9D4MRV6_DREPO|nr:hypothetical protein DPMN_004520 [Dreissena polymorpha]
MDTHVTLVKPCDSGRSCNYGLSCDSGRTCNYGLSCDYGRSCNYGLSCDSGRSCNYGLSCDYGIKCASGIPPYNTETTPRVGTKNPPPGKPAGKTRFFPPQAIL